MMWCAQEFMSGSKGGQLVPAFMAGCKFPRGVRRGPAPPVGLSSTHLSPMNIRQPHFPYDNVVVPSPQALVASRIPGLASA